MAPEGVPILLPEPCDHLTQDFAGGMIRVFFFFFFLMLGWNPELGKCSATKLHR
jgi:hypothetical protein